ncbi:MAG: N-acetyltransferase family protein, partial [Megasphaera sp.]
MVKMSQEIMIRVARDEDAADLARIYAYYVNETAITFEYQAPDVPEMEKRRKTILEQYPYLVAEKDGKVVGYAYAHEFYGRDAYA